MNAKGTEVCEFYGYQLDLVRRQLLSQEGTPVPLMPKAIDTLAHLVARAGETVSKDELMRAVWPDSVVEENNLTQNISALRKALGEKLGEHRFIVTVPGRGYRFVAPVRKLERVGDSRSVESTPRAPARPIAKQRSMWIAVAAIAIAALGTIAWRLTSTSNDPTPPHPRTIAILPFKPVVEQRGNEAIELGMADSLVMELSRSDRLIVRPLSATRRFDSIEQDPLEAGRILEVEAVVDGTIQIVDDRVRATARLLRVADGRQLWAGKFDEEFSSIFQVQDAIAQQVATALAISLNLGSHRQTENLRAYELYMRGRVHALRLVMPEVRRGIEYYERAIAEDPSYALPYAGMADALRALVLSNNMPPVEMAPRAKAAAERAIELAPDVPETNYARGLIAFWFDWDWKAAETYLSRAVELAPNNADAHIYLAHLHSNLGRKQQTLAHARRATELNPVSPMIGALEGQFLGYQSEHEEALERLREVVTLEPRFWLSHHLLAIELIDAGQPEASLQESAQAKQLSPLQTFSDSMMGVALARLGREDEAVAILESLLAAAREAYVPPTHLARIETALGNREAAIDQLEAALSVRDVWLVYLKIDPQWNDLRADSRFQAIMRQVGF